MKIKKAKSEKSQTKEVIRLKVGKHTCSTCSGGHK